MRKASGLAHGGPAMTREHQDGLLLLLLGCLFFAAVGFMWERTSAMGPSDFKETLTGARCLLEHRDPYQPDQLWAVYLAHGGGLPSDTNQARTLRLVVSYYTNLPTTLVLVAPLALLPWGQAMALWMFLIAACFIAACFCVWSLCAESAPRLSGALIFILMANSGLLLATGNTAGLVVGLAVISVFSFLRERFVPAGIACLAVALIIKPHDAGPIWLYFLLAGGVQRKRSLKAAALAIVLALPAVLWVSHLVPHWLPEYRSNLLATMSPGGRDYPSPNTAGAMGVGMTINLQAALSLIRDDPNFCNSITYAVCGVLLLLWSIKTLRAHFTPRQACLALAAVSAFTMLPLYHRTYDARLIVLAVPACAILWKEHRAPGRWAIALTLAAIVLTGDLFWIALFQITHYSGPSLIFGLIPAPLILLALGIFYLWIYLRCGTTPPDLQSDEA